MRAFPSIKNVSSCRYIVFPLRGIWTSGECNLLGLELSPWAGIEPLEFLRLASSVSSLSSHPLSACLVVAAKKNHLSLSIPEHGREFIGRGTAAFIDGRPMILGSLRFLQESGIFVPEEILDRTSKHERAGEEISFLGWEGKIRGFFRFQDPASPNAAVILERIKRLGFRPILLTGQARSRAQIIAQDLSSMHILSHLTPEEEQWELRRLKNTDPGYLYIGRGERDKELLQTAPLAGCLGPRGLYPWPQGAPADPLGPRGLYPWPYWPDLPSFAAWLESACKLRYSFSRLKKFIQ